MMTENTPFCTLFSGDTPQRIDLFLASSYGHSRTYFQELITQKRCSLTVFW